jgi:hypothetical protein
MKILFSIIVLTIMTATSFAQAKVSLFGTNFLNPTVSDARAHSLGKCEIMGANSSNAIFSNPAHIVNLNKTQFKIGGTIWQENLELQSPYNYEYKSQPIFSQFSFSTESGQLSNSVRAAYGFGLNRLYQRTYNTGEDDLFYFSPSIAFQYREKLRIGFTYNQPVFNESDMEEAFISIGALYPISEKFALGFIYKHENLAPSIFGLGGTYILNQKSHLYGEYQSRSWSNLKTDYFSGDYFDDGMCLRLGMETIVRNVPFRVGIYRDSLLDDFIDDNESINENGITCGFDLRNDKILVELCGEYSWYTIEYPSSNIEHPFGNGTTHINYKSSRYSLFVNMTYFL